MDIQLNKNISKDNLNKIKKLYHNTFPIDEQKPFDLIENHDDIELMSIENKDHFSGFIVLLHYKDITVLDYFVLTDNQQGKGIGSSVLQLLISHYNNQRLLIEIENSNLPSHDQKQRIRRKEFYLKNNLVLLPYIVNVLGVDFELLTNHTNISYDEYVEVYAHAYSDTIKEDIFLVK